MGVGWKKMGKSDRQVSQSRLNQVRKINERDDRLPGSPKGRAEMLPKSRDSGGTSILAHPPGDFSDLMTGKMGFSAVHPKFTPPKEELEKR